MSRPTDRAILKALFAHEFHKVMSDDEFDLFGEWLKDVVSEAGAGLLVAVPLGDGGEAYLHYRTGDGVYPELRAIERPRAFISKGDGCAFLPADLAALPCWKLGRSREGVPQRF